MGFCFPVYAMLTHTLQSYCEHKLTQRRTAKTRWKKSLDRVNQVCHRHTVKDTHQNGACAASRSQLPFEPWPADGAASSCPCGWLGRCCYSSVIASCRITWLLIGSLSWWLTACALLGFLGGPRAVSLGKRGELGT